MVLVLFVCLTTTRHVRNAADCSDFAIPEAFINSWLLKTMNNLKQAYIFMWSSQWFKVWLSLLLLWNSIMVFGYIYIPPFVVYARALTIVGALLGDTVFTPCFQVKFSAVFVSKAVSRFWTLKIWTPLMKCKTKSWGVKRGLKVWYTRVTVAETQQSDPGRHQKYYKPWGRVMELHSL